MRVIVYGVQKLDFVSADGVKIQGKSIFCGFENRYVDGLKTNKFFIPLGSNDYEKIVPDCEAELTFDYNGKIDNINVY